MKESILFSQVPAGKTVLKNRLVMPAMHIAGFSPDGHATPTYTDFYVARARGGVGTIIVGACDVVEFGGSGASLRLNDDIYIPAMKEMVSRIKEHDVTVLAQLYHMGRSAFSKRINGQTPVSSSAIASPWTGETPRELAEPEIREIVGSFGEAARRARDAGFDGVEFHGASGYLIAQFFSQVANRRTDQYGGSLENRCRFALELVSETRKRAGNDFLIFFRISGNEFMPGGQGTEEAGFIASRLEKAGVDVINVTGGFNESPIPQINMAVPSGAYAYLAREVKKAVGIPVVAGTRINTPELAEKIVLDGNADLVFMGRALIADPDFPLKVKEGRSKEICNCLGCNQGCFEQGMKYLGATCMMNPRVGHEADWVVTPAVKSKKVLVVGGGPAGMKAAAVCAERGHSVKLFESGTRLGGQLNYASLPPGRKDFERAGDHLVSRLKELRVPVEFNRKVDETLVLEERPDAVVIATGVIPIKPAIPGFDDPRVVFYTEVLDGGSMVGKRVVVIGGGASGCETAHYIAKMGTLTPDQLHFLARYRAEKWDFLDRLLWQGNKSVCLVEQESRIGQNIGATSRPIILGELIRFGVKIVTGAKALAFEKDGLRISRNNEEEVLEADTIVLAMGVRSNNQLAERLREKVGEVHVVGDANKPGTALEAIQEGFLAGIKI